MDEKNEHLQQVISYLTLRRLLGILGVLFPVILLLGCYVFGKCGEIQPSISEYYYTNMRDVFVGILFAIGLFLFSYKGYEKTDHLAGNFGCVFAVGVAIFPTLSPNPVISTLHLISATLLFLVLAYFSLFLFTKSKKVAKPTKQKRRRNRIYRVCGLVMLGCILLLFLIFAFFSKPGSDLLRYKPVFWLESLALWAFGISWLTKGEVLWRESNID